MDQTTLDTILLQRLKEENQKAFKLLFEKYWESMYAMAFKRTRCQNTSEDIVQEVFADIWKRRKDLNIQSNLKSYLLTAVKYYVYKSIQKNQLEKSLDESLELLPSHEGPSALEFKELYQILEVAIDKLPENQRIIFKLSRFEGLKSQEIAHKLAISTQTVHNNLHRSLKTLRTELKDYAPLLLGYLWFH